MIKLFASDLDGTLLNEFHESDEVILNAIQYVHDHNCFFTVATGRDMNGALRKTGFDKMGIYMICMNGAIIANPKQEIIFKKELNKQFLSEMLEEFPDVYFDCIASDVTYVRCSKKEHFDHFASLSIWKELKFSRERLEEFTSNTIFNCSNEKILSKDILKINCRIPDIKESQRFDEFLKKYSHCIINAPFDEGSYEITDISVNKGNAVMYLANSLNVQADEVAVYGDGGNDLDMLSMFKHSYATENAMDIAKAKASEVIGNCKDHAVPHHIIKTIG